MLIDELLNDGHDYILTARLQSDPIERRFSQYCQMSGGRFLVSLKEVRNTERILSCHSQIKNYVNFWKEVLQQPEINEDESYEMIDEMLCDRIEEISESVLDDDSSELATAISGYIAKKLLKRSKCKDYEKRLTVHDQDLQNNQNLTLLSRGGLLVPPKDLAEFVRSCFAVSYFVEGDILSIGQVTRYAMYVLKYHGPKCEFCCQYHLGWGIKFASKIVVNVYFNNKQKQAKDCVCKDSVESFKTRQRRK